MGLPRALLAIVGIAPLLQNCGTLPRHSVPPDHLCRPTKWTMFLAHSTGVDKRLYGTGRLTLVASSGVVGVGSLLWHRETPLMASLLALTRCLRGHVPFVLQERICCRLVSPLASHRKCLSFGW